MNVMLAVLPVASCCLRRYLRLMGLYPTATTVGARAVTWWWLVTGATLSAHETKKEAAAAAARRPRA